ncbi:MAG: hypothetical protein ACKVPX_18815 [Myxococcaceae bacterium]
MTPAPPGSPGSPQNPAARRSISREMHALSAERKTAISARKMAEQSVQDRIKDAAINESLNGLALLREAWGRFSRQGQYFKYRVIVIALWAVMAVTGMVVACPGNDAPSNVLRAQVVRSNVADNDVFMIVNQSDDVWTDVRFFVNETYSTAVRRVPPRGEVTLSARKLVDETGKPAPPNLAFQSLIIRTDRTEVVLMQGAKLLFEEE